MTSYAQYYSGTSGKKDQQSFLSNQPYQMPQVSKPTSYGDDALRPPPMAPPTSGAPQFQMPEQPTPYQRPTLQQPRGQRQFASAPYRPVGNISNLSDPEFRYWLRWQPKKPPGSQSPDWISDMYRRWQSRNQISPPQPPQMVPYSF